MTQPAVPAPSDAPGGTASSLLAARFPDLVLASVIAGCALLIVEMLIGGHTRGDQRIGLIVAAFGMAVGAVSTVLVATRWRMPAAMRALVLAGWAILVLGGLVGTWKHISGDDEGGEGGEAFAVSAVADWLPVLPAEEEGEGGEGGQGARKTPPLAPLSLSGLGMIGALAFIVGTTSAAARREDA